MKRRQNCLLVERSRKQACPFGERSHFLHYLTTIYPLLSQITSTFLFIQTTTATSDCGIVHILQTHSRTDGLWWAAHANVTAYPVALQTVEQGQFSDKNDFSKCLGLNPLFRPCFKNNESSQQELYWN
ncbi:hypothetical protein BDZ45DRAFT_69058 [Acephala macrosclerotiorum]|nr:hypothetical protein BDZ45DRAFT_69058 [Acephala macrosclerotiorum]